MNHPKDIIQFGLENILYGVHYKIYNYFTLIASY